MTTLRIGGWLPTSEATSSAESVEDAAVQPAEAEHPSSKPPEVDRDGPTVLANDTWGAEAQEGQDNVDYHGVRRAARRPFLQRASALVLSCICAGFAVLVVYGWWSAPDSAASPLTATVPGDWGTDVPDLPLPSEPSASGRSEAPAPDPTFRAVDAPNAKKQPPLATQPSPPGDVYEAEAPAPATTLSGSASLRGEGGASGGMVVRFVGNWDRHGGPGTLQFNNVSIAADGVYGIYIYYVAGDVDDGVLTGEVNVSGGPANVNVSFTGDSDCCGIGVVAVDVTLSAGTHSITIANADGRVPSIDRILISRR